MTKSIPPGAFSKIADHHFLASGLTRGPWNPEHQHAGPPVALVCRAIERAAAERGLTHISRITANLLRPVPIGEVNIEVSVDYAGRNAGHYSAQLLAGGKCVARFTALVQRETEVALPSTWPAEPAGLAPPTLPRAPELCPEGTFPFADAQVGYSDLVETRVASGVMFRGPCVVWFRLRHALVEGEAASAYQRIAVAADSGNGISAMLDFRKYLFVNSDLTFNLSRKPRGEWVGLNARTLVGPDGCGLATSNLFDTDGLVGVATQSLSIRARE